MNNYKIILASNSPRRRQLLAGLDVDFEVKVIPGIEETVPEGTPVEQIAETLARQKAEPYKPNIEDGELVLTADTIVVVNGEVLGKPVDEEEAKAMLHKISGKTHKVITGVCFTTRAQQHSFSVSTDVSFKTLPENEIEYYVSHYHPTDKAGAYGIQEWIGYVGVKRLEGSYFNVMGLPVQRIWEEIKKMSD
ncbi:MAG: septum formation protein Maf [Prevotella sp.]|nr:septum formation protein Maf [Prevotella sp.]